jgi:hypothetical protein
MVNDDAVTSVELPLPIREVWPYLREPELIRAWHGWEYDGLDEEIDEIFLRTARLSEDHRTLNLGTHLFNLFESEGTTRLEVVRCPPEGDAPQHLAEIDEGWTSFLEQLRFTLARHRGDQRRTVHVAGPVAGGGTSPIQHLGLAAVRDQAAGAAYTAEAATGDVLSGTVWFTSRHQLGLTVDDWGDGLLIVGEGPGDGPPYDGAQAILTTYGLDRQRHDDLTERWRGWWGAGG